MKISKAIEFKNVYTYLILIGDPTLVHSISANNSVINGIQHNNQCYFVRHNNLQEHELKVYDSFYHWGLGPKG